LFLGNLPWSIDGDKITSFFKSAGTVTSVRWLKDRETQEFKGVGWVTFSSTEEVDKAVELAGESIDGRQIRIDFAVTSGSRSGSGKGGRGGARALGSGGGGGGGGGGGAGAGGAQRAR
ncbi:hypothetical protein EMIHUDRAFT_59288, partial [Emiliania huxleyi CCMP1516]|uniref:RRM domain-containing protein n=2 Tax=Emiliania huxleyi TaxID=2903 RepID=A0A0D3I0P6_EMIH1